MVRRVFYRDPVTGTRFEFLTSENRRRTKRLEQAQARLAAAGQKLPPLVKSLQRCTQHSVKFILWIRAQLVVLTSCTQALASLATLCAKT